MENNHIIYKVQEKALGILAKSPSLKNAKLCGGTALSRCYLNHRVSYDLDFFLPFGFKPLDFARDIKSMGLKSRVTSIVDDPEKANQWHGFIDFGGQSLKVSLIEDAYFEVYPAVKNTINGIKLLTESLDGLYHRKILTISHPTGNGHSVGGRQTARDLFDLWVLSKSYCVIPDFIKTLPYDYPIECFEDGLQNMPWFDLIKEFKELSILDNKWEKGKDVEVVRTSLYSQLDIAIEFYEDDSHILIAPYKKFL
jgi:hypothetical protein